MQTQDRLLIRRILPTLLGLTLLGGLTAAPAFAHGDRDHKTHSSAAREDDEMMFDPAPMSYPQAAPGSINLYHWKDYTQRKMEPGSVSDKRWEIEHKKDKKRHERAAAFHKTFEETPVVETSTPVMTTEDTTIAVTAEGATVGVANDRYSGVSTEPTWFALQPEDIVLWPDATDPAAGQYLYILRGNTLYQLRTDDMSLQAMNSLPWLNSQTAEEQTVPEEYAQEEITSSESTPETAPPDTAAQQEDVDVYNKAISDDPNYGNVSTEESTTAEPTSDIPTSSDNPADENSDLNGKAYYHRSSVNEADQSPILTVSGDFVYVLRGNTLYQFRVSDLSLVSQTDLEESQ